ncbi:MAG TPA: Tad domain-containing protein [Sphingomicrobium sp.]|nr:Tad domain-containing protein [Sphingomicrobium sp.]
MIAFFKKLWHNKRGNALAIAAASLPLVLGSVGLASDTIQWSLWKRQLQRTADSAALAGVFGKLASQTVVNGACAGSTPVSRSLTVNNINSRLGTTPTCVVQAPPTSGAWTSNSYNAVKVTLTAQQSLSFSSLFISTAPTITAAATAAMVQDGKYCVISLKNTVATGLTFSGNPTVNLGCGMKTNAKGPAAVDPNGSPTITASPVAAVGQIASTTGFATGTTFQPYAPPQPDPYASITAPTVPSGCNQAALRGNANSVTGSNGTFCYTNLTLTSGQSASFTDATIILNGGDLTVNGGATLNCTRCTFILTTDATTISNNSIGKVTLNGGATINMSPPTTGTYANMVIYKDRRAPDCNNCNKINGNSSSSISGSIYIPSQEVQLSGDGGVSTNCIRLVAWTVAFNGNSTINNNCPGGPPSFDGYMVRLVE